MEVVMFRDNKWTAKLDQPKWSGYENRLNLSERFIAAKAVFSLGRKQKAGGKKGPLSSNEAERYV